MQPIISVQQALCRVNRHCLLQVGRFSIGPGEHWNLLGINGSGKSVLAALLLGKRRESNSFVRYGPGFVPQRDISEVSFAAQQHLWQRERRHDISEFSDSATDTGTSVVRCISARRSAAEQDPRLLTALLDALGLHGLESKGIRYLSSGEMRRMMLARALYGQVSGRVHMLVLDEPLESLDRESRGPVAECLARFLLPDTVSLRLSRRFDDILPGGTHLALMGEIDGVAAEKCLGIVAQGQLPAMLDNEAVNRFRLRRPLSPHWPDALSTAGSPVVSPFPYSHLAGTKNEPVAQKTGPLIELRGVSAGYGERQLFQGLDWQLNDGDHVLIEGPNGCGKSTLLGLIDGDNPQGYSQELYLFGHRKGDGESLWEVKSRFGVVSNELHNRYLKGWSVDAVVLSGFYDSEGLYEPAQASEMAQAMHWLTLVGLAAKANHHYHELSFGEQRLVLLARAMVKQPRILILDEPCVGLDDYHRRAILDLLDLIVARCRTQLIYVSHTRSEHPTCINRRLEFRQKQGPGMGCMVIQSPTRN